ncbi:IS66 family insertion sequence element accessory protein TnpA [Aminipila sp.]|uniref:IS66 family insertion sequence element accessory protein TnpA n=1 Tax=Aminipila sp. TaxID=2060095 RepID=UPI00289E3359|nr:transposase [Aminipila sp.]
MMNTKSLTPEKRFELVTECRKSGLTDYQWCLDHDINPGTFYNWITRFRKQGYPNIPETMGRSSRHKAVKQEVVKLEILPDTPSEPSTFPSGKPDPAPFFYDSRGVEPVMEICINGSIIRITNQISPQLLNVILSQLGGSK